MQVYEGLREPPPILKVLSHEVRWSLLLRLAQGDYRVQELVGLVAKPINLVSYHLRLLRDAALVQERRSSADGRDIYYSLDLARFETLYQAAAATLHPALGAADQPATADLDFPSTPARVLFLCTGNSARSQLAEALLRHMAGPRAAAFSAGSEPASVHPAAVRVLEQHGIATAALHAKHIDTYRGQSFDYIITVCDQAREVCPMFPGDPAQIHWSFPDPAAVAGSLSQEQAFAQTFTQLQTRLRYFLIILDRQRKDGP
jgi:ArsR family transcriptional regulator, arsenate/arsenite/antimonite-responsive transcriptional repressor / arsenate reductase (thioredoxin)